MSYGVKSPTLPIIGAWKFSEHVFLGMRRFWRAGTGLLVCHMLGPSIRQSINSSPIAQATPFSYLSMLSTLSMTVTTLETVILAGDLAT